MKRSFKNLFMIVMILASLVGSGIQAAPGEALGAMENVVVPASGYDATQLMDISGSNATDVYAVGNGKDVEQYADPLIYQKSSNAWYPQLLELPTIPHETHAGYLEGVWSSGSYAVAIGYSQGTVHAELRSFPLFYETSNSGTTWTLANPDPILPTDFSQGILREVWGTSTSDIYAVGNGMDASRTTLPLIYHKSTGWSVDEIGTSPGSLDGIWISGNDIFAVGYDSSGGVSVPLVYHSQDHGDTWQVETPALPTAAWESGNLESVWGANADDVYAVGSGNDGTGKMVPLLYHYDGTTWSSSTPSLPAGFGEGFLYSVWGVDENEVYLAGKATSPGGVPLLYRKAGGGWSASYGLPGWTTGNYQGIWGPGSDNVYAVGSGGQTLPLLAHAAADTVPPGPVTEFAANPGRSPGKIKLSWKASADDGSDIYSGPADSYFIKISTSSITNCASGSLVTTGVPVPAAPGTSQSVIVTSFAPGIPLTPGTSYYFAMCARDDDLLQSSPVTANATASTGYMTPEAVTLVSPSGSGIGTQPTYTWNENIDATWYWLWVQGPSGSSFNQWYAASTICSAGSCSITPSKALAPGNYTWYVQTYNEAGYGLWSTGMAFNVPVPVPPGKAIQTSPTGSSGTSNPTYQWNAVSNATWYYIYVGGPAGYVFTGWYSAATVCSAGTCSVANATPNLVAGNYGWYVQTYGNAGYGPWSDGLSFTVPVPVAPGKAIQTSPTGSSGTSNPTYQWNAVSNSTWYYIYVSGPAGYVFTGWYSAATVCSAGTCSVANATPSLGAGSYSWYVQTWNVAGYGPWSDGLSFTVPVPAIPGKAIQTSPTGSSGNNPTYQWGAASGATWYNLYVSGPSGYVSSQWFAASTVCGAGGCSVSGATPGLAAGSYSWWIQTWNDVGYGPWSDGLNFSVSP